MDSAGETWVEQPEEQTLKQGPPEPDERPEFLVGTGQIGPYLLEKELGRGTNGAVYQARKKGLAQKFAVKVLLNASPEAAERFQNEALVVGRIDDPGVITVVDVGKHKGRFYLAMDYVDGPSLRERLREGPLRPAEAAQLIASLARTMARGHQVGVLHRDLKPANVLLEERSGVVIPRVTDFGLARDGPGKRITNSEDILGTPHYMAPEQTEGAILATLRTDIYALGAILYQCLTGRTPFLSSGSFLELFEKIRTEDPPAPRSLDPQIPQALEEACLRAMAKDPHDRYATADLLADDLEAYLEGEQPAPEARTVSWTLIGVLAGLALGLALGVPLGFAARSQAEGPPVGVAPAPDPAPVVEGPRAGDPDSGMVPPAALKHAREALKRMRRGDVQGAIAAYTKAIEVAPKFAVAYQNRGFAYWSLHNREQAVANYTRALTIDPSYTLAWYNRGFCKLEEGHLEEAAKDFLKALKLEPDHGLAHLYLGRTHHMQGKHGEALEDFGRAAKHLKPGSEGAVLVEAWTAEATKALATAPR